MTLFTIPSLMTMFFTILFDVVTSTVWTLKKRRSNHTSSIKRNNRVIHMRSFPGISRPIIEGKIGYINSMISLKILLM